MLMSKPTIILLSLFLSLCFTIPEGRTQNPFDFAYRLPKTVQDSLNKNVNPFDIPNKREVKPKISLVGGTKIKKAVSLHFNKSQVPSQDLFWIYFGAALFVAVITSLSRSVFTKISRSVWNMKQMNIFYREVSNFYLAPMILLYIFWIFNLSIFTYFFCHYYSVPLISASVTAQIFAIFGVLTGVFVLKHLAWSFVAWVFPIEKEMNQYQFLLINYHIIIGIILMLINLILGYIPTQYVQFFLVIGTILVLSIFLVKLVAGTIIGSKYIFSSLFHFLLYLCTIEIAPILVLWKLIIVLTGY